MLVSTEEVHDELLRASKPALDRSLSLDSKRIVDIAFEDYIDFQPLGPKPKYHITGYSHEGMRGKLRVADSDGNYLGPDRAKIIISKKGGRARMLLKDPEGGEWVEPESYYSYGCQEYYDKSPRAYEGDGFTVKAVKAPVWHGIPGTALKFSTGEDTLFFSSDTVHDTELWESLASERHEQIFGDMSRDEFEAAEIIYGDINDLMERVWSPRRLEEARAAFKDASVIQDVSLRDSVVHTDYSRLDHTVLDRDGTLLTHSPDAMTSEWVLCYSDKIYRARGGRFTEVVGGKEYVLDADLYHKTEGGFFVGYKNPEGKYSVMDDNGILSVVNGAGKAAGKEIFKVDLYVDIGGEYFPRLDPSEGQYMARADGKVELVTYSDTGSTGKVVEGCRESLQKARK